MLQQVMDYLHNYFVPISAELKTYTISGGVISPLPDDIADGDRFLICGSRRNDGIYTWHADVIGNDDDERVPPETEGGEETIKAAGLRDETFAGTIRVCSVPPALLTLSGEISSWVAANSAKLAGPFESESFNGYSYKLKSGGGNGGNGSFTWMDQFKTRLDPYRRLFL